MISINFKTTELENTMKILMNRCSSLENAISDLKNMFLEEKAQALVDAAKSNYFVSCDFHSRNDKYF